MAANYVAGIAFTTTQLSGASAMLTWNLFEIAFDGETGFGKGRPTAVGTATGALVGLVVITPAAGLVSPMYAVLMGVIGAWSLVRRKCPTPPRRHPLKACPLTPPPLLKACPSSSSSPSS